MYLEKMKYKIGTKIFNMYNTDNEFNSIFFCDFII